MPVGTTLTLTAKSTVVATENALTLAQSGGSAFTLPTGGTSRRRSGSRLHSDGGDQHVALLQRLEPRLQRPSHAGLDQLRHRHRCRLRGQIGANINRLQAASAVESVQVQNLTAAEDQITAANIPQQVTNLSEYSILSQSGISALAQANSSQQTILKLLQ